MKDLVFGVLVVDGWAADLWPFLLVSDLSLFEGKDHPESQSKHKADYKEGAENSGSIVNSLNVTVLPDDICWLSGVDESWLLIEQGLLHSTVVVGTTAPQGFSLRKGKSYILMVVFDKSNEGADWLSEIFVLRFILDELLDLFLAEFDFFEVQVGDCGSSSLENVDQLMVVEGKLDVKHFNSILFTDLLVGF